MEYIESNNPFNGEVVGKVPVTPVEQIDAVVKRARNAQKLWGAMSIEERQGPVASLGESLLADSRRLAEIMAQEMGKPVKIAEGEVKACGALIVREAAEIVSALKPEVKDHGKFIETRYFDPLGVSLAITPWNFPLLMPVWQVLPALMAGNSVILKPSEETPLIAQAFVDLASKHLPADVLTIVHGDGTQGKALVRSDVNLITFTGSRAAGLHILKEASEGLKRVILELGGKDPLIVLKEADVTAAAKFAAVNGFRNSGQVCVSTERIYVEDEVFEDFNSQLVTEIENLKLGDSMDDSTDLGPMVNRRQKEIVDTQISQAIEAGAKVLTGAGKTDGNFVRPTVLTNVDHSMSVMSDETFGPVVGVMSFKNEDQAINMANDSRYGLGAVVYGQGERAERVARQLDSGMIAINRSVSGIPNSPWVGAKESGYGFHSSEHGHRQFCQVRVVSRMK